MASGHGQNCSPAPGASRPPRCASLLFPSDRGPKSARRWIEQYKAFAQRAFKKAEMDFSSSLDVRGVPDVPQEVWDIISAHCCRHMTSKFVVALGDEANSNRVVCASLTRSDPEQHKSSIVPQTITGLAYQGFLYVLEGQARSHVNLKRVHAADTERLTTPHWPIPFFEKRNEDGTPTTFDADFQVANNLSDAEMDNYDHLVNAHFYRQCLHRFVTLGDSPQLWVNASDEENKEKYGFNIETRTDSHWVKVDKGEVATKTEFVCLFALSKNIRIGGTITRIARIPLLSRFDPQYMDTSGAKVVNGKWIVLLPVVWGWGLQFQHGMEAGGKDRQKLESSAPYNTFVGKKAANAVSSVDLEFLESKILGDSQLYRIQLENKQTRKRRLEQRQRYAASDAEAGWDSRTVHDDRILKGVDFSVVCSLLIRYFYHVRVHGLAYRLVSLKDQFEQTAEIHKKNPSLLSLSGPVVREAKHGCALLPSGHDVSLDRVEAAPSSSAGVIASTDLDEVSDDED